MDWPILVVSPDYPPPFVGGSLVQIHNLVNNFPAACEVLAGGRSAEPTMTAAPHRVIRHRRLVGSSPDPSRIRLAVMYAFLVLFGLTRARRYRAIVAHTGVVGNSLLFLIGRFTGVLVVGLEYGETVTLAFRGKGLKNAIKRLLINVSYPHAGGFIVLSVYTRELLMRFGVRDEQVWIRLPALAPGKHRVGECRRSRGRIILSCGRLIQRKGFDLLIDAVATLVTAMPDLHLDIVGDGPLREALVRQIGERGLERVVRLHGRASDDELAKLYEECDVFVLANITLDNGDSEDAPSTAIEASAYGKPVIIGSSGGTASTVEDGVTGYRIDPSNRCELVGALERVLNDPALARAMGEAGRRKIAEQHDPVTTARDAYGFIVSLLDRRLRENARPARGAAA